MPDADPSKARRAEDIEPIWIPAEDWMPLSNMGFLDADAMLATLGALQYTEMHNLCQRDLGRLSYEQ